MVNSDYGGERNLIFAIFKQAISDALLCKNPEFRKRFKTVKKKKTRTKSTDTLRKTFLFVTANFRHYPYDKFLLSIFIVNMIDKICDEYSIECKSNRIKALDARKFLNKNNPSFCMYLEMVDIDPVYAHEKINNQLGKFDRGNKSIFKPYLSDLDALRCTAI
jgi:hypothetical protein